MNTVDDTQNLQKYIEDINLQKNSSIISDSNYWSQKGVITPDHFDRYMLISHIQEAQKYIYGSCKSRIVLEDLTTSKLKDLLNHLKSKRKI